MKIIRLLGSLALSGLLALTAYAAEFEGTLRWSLSAEITDPEMKAQMAEARKQLADPEKLAQMKGMMESPQMKAAMEQNPQMKAAMEMQIKMAEEAVAGKGGDDMVTAMMPRSVTVRTKGGKSHMSTEGGAMPMEVISIPEPAAAFWIDRASRTFARLPIEEAEADAAKLDAKVSKGPGTAKILGYNAQEYLLEIRQDDVLVRGQIWATNEIPGLDSNTLAKARFGGQDAGYLKQVEGVPLKMEMTMPQMRILMQATEVAQGSVPDSLFTVPEGFAEKPFAFGPPQAAAGAPGR
jgi:hypothetical protein